MKRINLILTILIMTGAAFSLQAQLFTGTSKVGTTAAQFLKIGAGSRALGMGGAYTAVSDDIYATYWNPAGVATSKKQMEASFNHVEWIADITYDYAAASLNLGGVGTVFASLTTLSVPDSPVRTPEYPEGDGRVWDAGDLAMGLGYAKMLTDRFSFGIQLKYVRQAIWNSSASGFAVDLGTLYRTPFNDLMIGASITNFGSKLQLDGRDIQFNTDPNSDPNSGPNNVPANFQMEEFDMPLTFKIGLAMDVVETRFINAKVALDAVHPNDNTEYVNTGLELAYDQLFFFRAGFKTLFMQNREQGLTLGGGINYDMGGMVVNVNYAYSEFENLKEAHFIDVGIKL